MGIANILMLLLVFGLPEAQQSGNAARQNTIELLDGASFRGIATLQQLRTRAEQGKADAPNNLGRIYAKGEGVPKALVTAYMWFNLSAVQGDEYGKTARVLMETMMTPDQIAEAQRLTKEWISTNPK